MYKKITLKNNLRVLLIPSTESKSVNVTIYVKAGSRFENEKNSGIAHFIEHVVHRGTKSYPTELDLSKVVEGMGASWNASTGDEVISYYVKAESSNVNSIIKILNELVFSPLYNPSDLEKEKGVIIEEINMYNDVPEYKVAILADELLFPNHPLGRNIAGSKETVASFKREDLISYGNEFFSPSNIVVGVSGKFNEKEILDLLNESFSDIEDFTSKSYELFKDQQSDVRIKCDRRESEQSHVVISYHGLSKTDERRYALRLAAMILGGGISSRFHQKIRSDKGLAYSIHAGTGYFMDTGIFQISAGVRNEACVSAIGETFREINKFLNDVSEEELEREKNHYIGLLALHLEDHADMNTFLCEQELLTGNILSYEDVVNKIKATTLEEMLVISKEILQLNKANIAVVGSPSEEQIRKELENI